MTFRHQIQPYSGMRMRAGACGKRAFARTHGRRAFTLVETVLALAIFVMAPGAFLVLCLLVAFQNAMHMRTNANKKVQGCSGDCCSCQAGGCESCGGCAGKAKE